MEGITILPIVIPPIVLIVGVLQIAPGSLQEHAVYCCALVYVVLAMPFAYRSLDAGLRGVRPEDAGRGVELARRGLAVHAVAGRAAQPDRTAMLSATVLTVALVLGEFTMASLGPVRRPSRSGSWSVRPDQRAGIGGRLTASPCS